MDLRELKETDKDRWVAYTPRGQWGIRTRLFLITVLLATAIASWADDTAVVKVLAYYGNGTISQGTGWFINGRLLVTDYHVIRSSVSYEVTYEDGMVRKARLWISNPACDLAVPIIQS